MNLKETIISSLFFHLILFLLLIAASHFTTGLSSGNRKSISVDLSLDNSKEQSPAQSSAAVGQSGESALSPEDGTGLPVQAVSKPPEEPERLPEPDRKPETAEKPAVQREGFSSMEAYYQFIILHTKIFGQQAGARVNELLGAALKVNKREFYGGTAMVSLKFGPDSILHEVFVDSDSPALKAFFEEIDWSGVPAPAAFFLKSSGVQIEFTVHEGYMGFTIKAL